jgi:hypothetical protein
MDVIGPLLTAAALVAVGVALDPAPARVIRTRVDARLAADTARHATRRVTRRLAPRPSWSPGATVAALSMRAAAGRPRARAHPSTPEPLPQLVTRHPTSRPLPGARREEETT